MSRLSILTFLSMFLLVAEAAGQDRFEAMQYGSVVDERGRPMAHVEVRGLWRPGYHSPLGPSLVVSRTDTLGQFVVPLPVGEVSGVEIVAIDDNGQAAYTKRDVTRPNEPAWQPAKLVLKPCHQYHVRLQDEDGLPVSGAKVSALPEFLGDFVKPTDQQGEVTIISPVDCKADAIVAWGPERGIDYVPFDHFGKLDAGKIKPTHRETVAMTLSPWETHRMQVIDLDGKPIPGVAVSPEYFQTLKRSALIRPGSLSTVYTDAQGWAKVRLPQESVRHPIEIRKPGYYPQSIGDYSLSVPQPMVLSPVVRVTGVVLLPDGSPAEDVSLRVEGASRSISTYYDYVKTDHRGRFEAELPGNSYCLVLAKTDKMAVPARQFIVPHDRPVDPLTLSLQPMARVSGTVTDRNGEPMQNERIIIHQADGKWPSYFHALSSEQHLAKPPRNATLSFRHGAMTDERGKYEVYLGPGRYEIKVGDDPRPKQLTIDSSKPLELDLKDKSVPKRWLRGRVVMAGVCECSVAGARVKGLAQDFNSDESFYFVSFKKSCGLLGNFETEVLEFPYVVSVTSRDGKCRGLAFVPPDKDQINILLAPPVKVVGTLLEEDGTPVANRPLTAIVEYTYDGHTQPAPDKHGTTTDAQGRFELTGLVAGQKYTVRILRKARPGDVRQRLEFACHFTTERNHANQKLGEVKIAAPSEH